MRLGPIEFSWKSYSQLDQMIRREKLGDSSTINLKTDPVNQIAAYRSWVYNCVSLISDRISTLPYGFYNSDTGDELNSKNKGYKIFTKPFTHPNDLMTFRFIKSWCQVQLDLCGMACIYKAKNKLNQVWELWPLNMNDFVKVEINGMPQTAMTDSIINPSVRYFFRSGNGWIDFDVNELIVINYPHPANPYAGMSPIQAEAFMVDIDTYIEVYERDFFKNSARIDFALATDEPIDQPKADEIKERWMEKFQGKFHDVAVLDSGLKPIPLKYTNKDFEFLNLAKWPKEKILGCYRVPESKLGSVISNRAGSVYSDISFNRESVQPRLTLWDEELTDGVCSSFDSRLQIKHQNPIPRDRMIELQENKSYLGGLPSMSINEFRTKIHKLPDVVNGDKIILKTTKGFYFLDELHEIPLAQRIGSSTSNDRNREEGDTQHVNPDGSDDRDDNPTDGRSAPMIPFQKYNFEEFYFLINKSRILWNEMIYQNLINVDSEKFELNLKSILMECISASINVFFDYYHIEKFVITDVNDWITNISSKIAFEYNKALRLNPKWKEVDWKDYFKEQFDSNPRLSKIINCLIRSCINYTKWLIMTSKNIEMQWKINSNECGHKGRIKNIYSFDNFIIGKNSIRFPGEIHLSTNLMLNCDCTIIRKKGEN